MNCIITAFYAQNVPLFHKIKYPAIIDPQPGERVLDLCAGTGCLGLGVKRFCPAAQVTSLEKSPAAYRYLEQNAHLSPVLTITPVQGDLFTYWQTLPEGQLDLIVSNPPYLTAAEMGALQPLC